MIVKLYGSFSSLPSTCYKFNEPALLHLFSVKCKSCLLYAEWTLSALPTTSLCISINAFRMKMMSDYFSNTIGILLLFLFFWFCVRPTVVDELNIDKFCCYFKFRFIIGLIFMQAYRLLADFCPIGLYLGFRCQAMEGTFSQRME